MAGVKGVKNEYGLTPKQENFVQGLISGMGQAEAYKAAYSTKRMTSKSIDETASNLRKDPKISSRILGIQRQNENTAIWTRAEALERLKRIADEARQATSEPILDSKNNVVGVRHNSQAASVELKSIEQAAKMCGFNEPDKTDTTVKFNNIEEFLKVAGESEY